MKDFGLEHGQGLRFSPVTHGAGSRALVGTQAKQLMLISSRLKAVSSIRQVF